MAPEYRNKLSRELKKEHLLGYSESMNEKLEKIEVQIAFMEQTIQDLNQAVISQQKQLDDNQKRIQVLSEMYRDLKDSGSQGKIPNRKPPHY